MALARCSWWAATAYIGGCDKAGRYTEAISKAHGDDEAGGHTEETRDEKEKAIKNNRLLRPKTGEMPEREPPPRGGAITTEGINEGPGP
jgi:hypothetical protein